MALLGVANCSQVFLQESQESETPEEANRELIRFVQFMQDFDKRYDDEEQPKRFEAFKKTVKFVDEHNAEPGNMSFMRLNQFADRLEEEKRPSAPAMQQSNNIPYVDLSANELTGSYRNWQDANVGRLMPPRFQEGCSYSSYAFAATAAMEFLNDPPQFLSLQQMVDCSWVKGNKGCDQGDNLQSFSYLKDNNVVLVTEESYVYNQRQNQKCWYNEALAKSNKNTKLPNFKRVNKNSNDLRKALDKGPVVGAICGDAPEVEYYGGGVISHANCQCNQPNQMVLITGYGHESGTNVFYIKNSLKNWGEGEHGGLARIADKGANGMACGLLNYDLYLITDE